MRHRRDLLNPHFVGALNLIAVEFSKDKKVTEAWKKLLVELSEVLPKELSEERSTAQYKKIHEAQTRLLSAVAENLGLNIEQLDIQEAYAPQGWFNVDTDLSRLRGLALASSHPLACKWLETKRKGHIFELRVCQSLLLE